VVQASKVMVKTSYRCAQLAKPRVCVIFPVVIYWRLFISQVVYCSITLKGFSDICEKDFFFSFKLAIWQ